MTFAEIEAFDAVMRLRSTNRAAEALGVSQPAISRALARLSASTGITLFETVRGRLVPTPEGVLFHQEVRQSFVGLDRLRSRAAGIREFGTGSLRVACYPALGLSFMPKAVRRFRDMRPQCNLTLTVCGSVAARDLVVGGQVDLALAADEVDITHVDAQIFMTPYAVCVLRKDHPLARKEQIAPMDLVDEDLIALSPDDTVQKKIEAAFTQAGVRPRTMVETQYSETVCNLALEGVGVGIANAMSFRASHFDQRGLAARTFVPTIAFRALLLTPTDRQRSQDASAFIKALHDVRNTFG
jgi:DNA-binding transcriptional LysR family regulator